MPSFAENLFTQTARSLLTGETGFVASSGAIVTGNAAAVTMAGNSALTVLGTLNSSFSGGTVDGDGARFSLLVGSTGFVGNSAETALDMATATTLSLTNRGFVHGASSGLLVTGNGQATVLNYGTISGVSGDAIRLEVNSGLSAFVTNSGLIEGGSDGIEVVTGQLTLRNSGTILSRNGSSVTSAGLEDAISNYGTLVGKVETGGGTDTITNFAGGLIDGSLNAGDGNDVVTNYGHINDVVILGAGDDTFRGTGGTLGVAIEGGTGNDIYVIDDPDTFITELTGEGVDRIRAAFSFVMSNDLVVRDIENLDLTGVDNLFAIGNALNNVIRGNVGANRLEGRDGDDTLSGGEGIDTLIGGLGNDTYVNPTGDTVTELAGEGIDTVQSSITFSISGLANIENITLAGAGLANATGNAAANRILGNEAGNVLDGGAGADTMIGGAGGDVYFVDNAGDQTIELANQGTDAVVSSISRTLGDNIERLTLSGTASIDGNGNALANEITGNSGNNILRGDAQNDTLNGGGGNDILLGGTGRDTLTPGTDAVQDIIRYSAINESSGTTRDLVIGLNLDVEDKIDLTVVVTSLNFVSGGNLSTATFNADLAAAVNGSLDANGAVLLNPAAGDLNLIGHVYVVVDANGDGNYSSGLDYVIQLVNSTGTLTLDDFI
jgi:Ca2+-binding RTX toxin-like protein